MTPVFQLSVGDKDITSLVQKRLISLVIHDSVERASCSLEFTVDNRDAVVKVPSFGANLPPVSDIRKRDWSARANGASTNLNWKARSSGSLSVHVPRTRIPLTSSPPSKRCRRAPGCRPMGAPL